MSATIFHNQIKSFTIECAIALCLFTGTILCLLIPPVGRILLLSAILPTGTCYLFCGLSKVTTAIDGRFLLFLYRFNYLGAAAVVLFLMPVVLDWKFSVVFSIINILVGLVCLTLNAANRYLYRIPDERYLVSQLRMILLVGVTVILQMI
ncbi:MAG: hypothetical protein M0Q38_14510 [Bacteroidales bacterium]|jgi:hypothetical protein|nr:hypothetical protein [Bacteroidales bacterium]